MAYTALVTGGENIQEQIQLYFYGVNSARNESISDIWHRKNEASCKLAEIPGIGPITASALAASVGDGKSFKSGGQLAAWLGLVPRQHSTGGKSTLLGISKRGDSYLRTLLIHGARSVIRVAQAKTELTGSWLQSLLGRRNKLGASMYGLGLTPVRSRQRSPGADPHPVLKRSA